MNREHFLREIRPTAEANGGKPPGWRRVQSATGIPYTDWHGKFWVRWNDAIHEAGYVANQRTKSHDASELLDKHSELIREPGRLPVSGDLRLKAWSDPEFPSERPFARSVVSRRWLPKRLASAVADPGMRKDVAAFKRRKFM